MIRTDEDALICDLAETYQILNYRSLPVRLVATLSVGLRNDSRIKLLLSNQQVPIETLLLALAVDRLSMLLWSKTKDGQRGINAPKSIASDLINKKETKDFQVFETLEDFNKRYKELVERA